MVTDPEQLETMITLRTHSMLYVLWTVLLEEMRKLYGKQIIQTKVMLATSIWLHSDSHRPRRRRDKSIRRDSKEGFDHILLAAFRVVLYSRFATSILHTDTAIIHPVLADSNHWSELFPYIITMRTHIWFGVTSKKRKRWDSRLIVPWE